MFEIDKRAASECPFFCKRLLDAAQPAPVAILERACQGRKQSEIDVHWLVGARPRIDGTDVPARDVVQQGASMEPMCPPVMWFNKAPMAVVGGGAGKASPRISAAAYRPARSPIAADST
jgi:hypothetical protein